MMVPPGMICIRITHALSLESPFTVSAIGTEKKRGEASRSLALRYCDQHVSTGLDVSLCSSSPCPNARLSVQNCIARFLRIEPKVSAD